MISNTLLASMSPGWCELSRLKGRKTQGARSSSFSVRSQFRCLHRGKSQTLQDQPSRLRQYLLRRCSVRFVTGPKSPGLSTQEAHQRQSTESISLWLNSLPSRGLSTTEADRV